MNAQLCCLDIVERQETIPEMMQTFWKVLEYLGSKCEDK